MSNITISIFSIILAFWIYSIFSIYTGSFKNSEEKIFWKIGIVLVPFLAFFYIFRKKDLLK